VKRAKFSHVIAAEVKMIFEEVFLRRAKTREGTWQSEETSAVLLNT